MLNLQTIVLGNPIQDWLTALTIALIINLLIGVIKWAITRRFADFLSNGRTNLDDSLVEMARRTRQWLVFAITLYMGARYLELPPKLDLGLTIVATLAAFIQVGLWAGTALDFWIGRTRKRALIEDAGATTSLAALSFIGHLLIWTMVLLLALDNLGVNVTALVAGLGVGGIAVALAMQNILGDLFASLSIVIDKPFVIGDFIVVGDDKGTVEHVGLKTTRVRSLSGEQLVFANGDLLKSRVRNHKRMYERRNVFSFGVLYQTQADELEWIPGEVKRIIEAQELTRFDRAHFQKFGDSSLDFEAVYWLKDPDFNRYMDVQQAINLALVRSFAKKKIGFAYPTRSLLIETPLRVEAVPPPAPAA